MALVQGSNIAKISAVLMCRNYQARQLSTKTTARSSAFNPKTISSGTRQTTDIKKSVFISQSKDIYTNLALEDWMYRNMDFANHHVLMLWQSDPCVVIGRHQNPWIEANVSELNKLSENGIKLARRNSGGGTVYHDNGNLNLTFFTNRNHYDRKYNLEVITRALFREYQLKLTISPRDDLTLRNTKVSGTAAKLGRPNAYHHCTLLVNSDKKLLSQALQKSTDDITTNATKSIRSKIMNICEDNPRIKVDDLYKIVGWEYLRTTPIQIKDGGLEFANKQNGFQMINPTEKWFPGLNEIQENLKSWEWRYGKSPKFTLSRSFPIPENFLLAPEVPDDLKVTMIVENGIIQDVKLYVPPGLIASGYSGNVNVITSLIGHRFTDNVLCNLEWSLANLLNDKTKFVTECVRQVMTCV